MTAPVNPEGQTARDAKWAAGQLRHLYQQMANGSILHQEQAARRLLSPAIATLEALTDSCLVAQPSEGQTAQEVRRAALEEAALYLEKHRPPMWTRYAVAQMIRALASTPSPAKQTEQKIASAEGAASQLGAAPATCGVSIPSRIVHDAWTTCRNQRPCGEHAPAPAQPDARDADYCARAIRHEQERWIKAEADLAARDAEIARLREELEAATATIEDEQAAHEETRADAARLTKERDFEREQRDLRHAGWREEKARADAAEAQAKALREALDAKGAYLIKDAAELKREAKALDRRGETADAAFKYGAADYAQSIGNALRTLARLSPAQPSQDVAGTSGEILAGLSKEGGETPSCDPREHCLGWSPHPVSEDCCPCHRASRDAPKEKT